VAATASSSADVADTAGSADVAATASTADVAATAGSADVAATAGSADVAATASSSADVAATAGSADVAATCYRDDETELCKIGSAALGKLLNFSLSSGKGSRLGQLLNFSLGQRQGLQAPIEATTQLLSRSNRNVSMPHSRGARYFTLYSRPVSQGFCRRVAAAIYAVVLVWGVSAAPTPPCR
jgi:hypothetical protein